jgi:hypothetical protein
MNTPTFICGLSVIVLLSGCEQHEQIVNEAAGGVILEYQLDALEQAKRVEDINLGAERVRREQMDKQGI